MTRIGLHLHSNRSADLVVQYAELVQPKVMKSLAPDKEIIDRVRVVSPGTKWIGRVVWNPQDFDNYADFQRLTLSKAREFRGYVHAWEGYNEVGYWGDELREFARREVGLAKRLNDLGVDACIGGFSTGFMDRAEDGGAENFDKFMQAIEYCHEHPDAAWLHFHEYAAPYNQFLVQTPDGRNQWDWNGGGFTGVSDDWTMYYDPGLRGYLTLRYRLLRERLVENGLDRVRFVITESGLDGGLTHPYPGPRGGGWQSWDGGEWSRKPGIGDFADQEHWYAWQLSHDPYVVGAVMFGFGTIDPKWNTWDLSRRPDMLLRLANRQRELPVGPYDEPQPEPQPEPGDPIELPDEPQQPDLPVEPLPEPQVLMGVDVSHHQGDWQASVARERGIEFAIVKVTDGYVRHDGSLWVDPNWRANAQGASAQGMLVGPYHYFRNDVPWQDQLQHFVRVCEDHAWTLPPMVDFEDKESPANPKAMREFCEGVELLMSRPVIYTARWWWNAARLGKSQPWAAKYPLCIADYSGPVDVPTEWETWTFRQFTSTADGSLYGATSEHIDLQTTRLSRSELRDLLLLGPGPGLDLAALREYAKTRHEVEGIRLNVDAALAKAIAEDDLWPLTNEADWDDGIVFQVAGDPATGEMWAYWWGDGVVRRATL